MTFRKMEHVKSKIRIICWEYRVQFLSSLLHEIHGSTNTSHHMSPRTAPQAWCGGLRFADKQCFQSCHSSAARGFINISGYCPRKSETATQLLTQPFAETGNFDLFWAIKGPVHERV
jgi:hypothetical protein